jgi:hypothetical protein
MAVLDRAIAVVRSDPPELIRADYVESLADVLESRPPGALTVVFQTASMFYLTPEERERVRETLDRAAREAPLAWVSAGGHLVEGMTTWDIDARLLPSPTRVVAHADFHGAWIDWFPSSA